MFRLFVIFASAVVFFGCAVKRHEPLVPQTGAIIHDVPFTCQAPEPSDWGNPMYNDGCEESCSGMVWAYFLGQSLPPDEARHVIVALSEWEQAEWGFFEDASAKDTATILEQYPHILGVAPNFSVRYEIVEYNSEVLKEGLRQGKLAILHVNATLLGNPYYKNAPHHAILAIGFTRNKIIVNDPATKHGEAWAYSIDVLEESVADYTSGHAGKYPPDEIRPKKMILVWKK